MVLEIAQIDVKPGMEAEFEAGVAKAGPLFQRAKGCKGMTLPNAGAALKVRVVSCRPFLGNGVPEKWFPYAAHASPLYTVADEPFDARFVLMLSSPAWRSSSEANTWS